MMFAGIDPGKDGAFAILDPDGQIVEVWTMPTIGKEYDKQEMIKRFNQYEITHAVLENVHAPQLGGRTSCFEFGRGKGLLEMLLFAQKIPFTQVTAQTWQKTMWQGVSKQYKISRAGKSVDTKNTSLLACKRLFPFADLRRSEAARVAHDGIVDAVLMAEYCRRNFK